MGGVGSCVLVLRRGYQRGGAERAEEAGKRKINVERTEGREGYIEKRVKRRGKKGSRVLGF